MVKLNQKVETYSYILVSLLKKFTNRPYMEAFDFAGRTKLPRGPHVARGPQVGKP